MAVAADLLTAVGEVAVQEMMPDYEADAPGKSLVGRLCDREKFLAPGPRPEPSTKRARASPRRGSLAMNQTLTLRIKFRREANVPEWDGRSQSLEGFGGD